MISRIAKLLVTVTLILKLSDDIVWKTRTFYYAM